MLLLFVCVLCACTVRVGVCVSGVRVFRSLKILDFCVCAVCGACENQDLNTNIRIRGCRLRHGLYVTVTAMRRGPLGRTYTRKQQHRPHPAHSHTLLTRHAAQAQAAARTRTRLANTRHEPSTINDDSK